LREYINMANEKKHDFGVRNHGEKILPRVKKEVNRELNIVPLL
jgi:hypothetical protein